MKQYSDSSLDEAGVAIGLFPRNLIQELLVLNKAWSDTRRQRQVMPPPNDTPPLATASYYKPGTSMTDNIYLFVRPPKNADGVYTIEDQTKNVLAHAPTLDEIALEWHRLDRQKVIGEELERQGTGSSDRRLSLI